MSELTFSGTHTKFCGLGFRVSGYELLSILGFLRVITEDQ